MACAPGSARSSFNRSAAFSIKPCTKVEFDARKRHLSDARLFGYLAASAAHHRTYFRVGGFRSLTPGPQPFSSMNSTPALSRAWRSAASYWNFPLNDFHPADCCKGLSCHYELEGRTIPERVTKAVERIKAVSQKRWKTGKGATDPYHAQLWAGWTSSPCRHGVASCAVSAAGHVGRHLRLPHRG